MLLNSVGFVKTTLLNGFTTVRDLGGTGVNISVRNAIDAGKIPGPRVFTAGKSLATTGGHADPTNGSSRNLIGDPGPKEGVVNSVEDAKKAVRQRYKKWSRLDKNNCYRRGFKCREIGRQSSIYDRRDTGNLPNSNRLRNVRSCPCTW